MGKFNEHAQVAKEHNVGGGANYWRPEAGENRVRVLSEPEAFANHFIKSANRSFVCIGKDKGCEHCLNEDKPKVQYLMWAMVKKDNMPSEIVLAQVGYSVIKPLGELANSADWAFDTTPDYDVIIKKSGEGLKTEYAVTPTPNKDLLTDAEKELASSEMTPIAEIIQAMKDKIVPVEVSSEASLPTTSAADLEKQIGDKPQF